MATYNPKLNPFTGKLQWVIDETSIAHADLSDMPDTGGTNTDHDNRYLTLDQTTPQTLINGVPLTDWALSDITNSLHLVNKEYVDSAVSFIAEYYFNDTASSIGGIYYKMLDTPTGEAESTLTSASLTTGDDQNIFNFATDAGIPGVDVLEQGIYNGHIHAEKTAGTKPVKLYFAIYRYEADTTETLIATSEESDFITSKGEVNLHATLTANVDILVADRIIIKWFANVDATGSDATIALYTEGTTSAHLKVPTSAATLNSVFLRQDGTKPLTANWNVGAFDITAVDYNASGDFLPTIDRASDLGATLLRFEDVFINGNLSNGIDTVTVGQATAAYTHSQDNTQAHSDYLLNSGSDTMSGTLTCNGVTMDANELITLGGQTLKHDATDFVFDDRVNATAGVFGNGTNEMDVSTAGILTFNGTGVYKVRSNQFAFSSEASANAGMKFNTAGGNRIVMTNTSAAEYFQARLDNSIICGTTSALATNATDGFLYVPTCAGTPTGTPTTYTAKSAIVVDSTNNKLYFYSGGAWQDAGP